MGEASNPGTEFDQKDAQQEETKNEKDDEEQAEKTKFNYSWSTSPILSKMDTH